MTTVVICDPPSPLRGLLAERVGEVPGVAVVETVDDADTLSVRLQEGTADLVLLASRLGGARASATIRRIRRNAPGIRILLLTMGTDPDEVISGMAAGAAGYLARDAAVPEVAAALALLPEQGSGGDRAMPEERREGGSGAPGEVVPAARRTADVELTDRELQVLQGMSRGRSNSQIGEDLFLSEDTIKTHARRLFRKLDVNDRAHAVAEGFRRGMLA